MKSGASAPAKPRPGKIPWFGFFSILDFYCSATHQNGEIVNYCKRFYFEEDSQFKAGSAAVFRIITWVRLTSRIIVVPEDAPQAVP
jgi:hypothetical protein